MLNYINLGDKLIKLRKEKNLLQKDIAKALGISKATYSTYEQNKFEPNIKTLINISKLFNVSIDYLLNLSTEKGFLINNNLSEYENNLLNIIRGFDNNKIDVLNVCVELIENLKNNDLTDYENSVITNIRKMTPKEIELFNMYMNFIKSQKNS